MTEVVTWKERRGKMKTVCRACHTSSVVEGHYKQFDDLVDLYNDKFAKPIAAIMGDLKKDGYITKTPFNEAVFNWCFDPLRVWGRLSLDGVCCKR
ncbi:MAG: hypothetical protein GY807_10850 [Gammaproteobacteria bacterium]|nr:hypothetical protein [Gammaproteobacteria bacterium]